MSKKIRQALREALQGSRQIKITFKLNAIPYITYLFAMADSDIISFSTGDRRRLATVKESHDWGNDSSRTITIILNHTFNDENWFIDNMWRALEEIDVVK